MAAIAATHTATGGILRLIKSDSGKSLYLAGDTKPVKEQIKALKDLAFPPKWNNKKQAWNIVPGKKSMASVLEQLRHLFAVQAQQAEQMPEVSSSVAWVPPKVAKTTASTAICKGVKVNGEPCKYKAKYGGYCGHHKK